MRTVFRLILLLCLSVQVYGQQIPMPIGTGAVVATGNTYDPSNKAAGITLSNGNKTATQASGGWTSAKGLTSYAITTGKKYMEVSFSAATSSNIIFGYGNASASVNNYCGSDANGWGYYAATGWVINNGAAVEFLPTYTTGDVMMVAIDAGLGRIWFGKNGTWVRGDPATNTLPAATGLTGSLVPMISGQGAWSGTANFGSSAFTYTPPSGFTGY